jgi:hypothetical protein
MQKLITVFLVLCSLTVHAQNTLSDTTFRQLAGNWIGNLTYTDYKDNRTQVTMRVRQDAAYSNNQLIVNVFYTEPESAREFAEDAPDTLYVAPGGAAVIEGAAKKTVTTVLRKKNFLQFVTEAYGMDDNKPALIRKTVTIGPALWIVKKEVRFKGSKAFLTRHIYTCVRQKCP